MNEVELAKHIALDGTLDIDALAAKFDEISGYLRGWEKRQPKLIQETLNKQASKEVDEFNARLKWAEEKQGVRPYVEDDDEPMESISDFALKRGTLEYFRQTMLHIRLPNNAEVVKAIKAGRRVPDGRLPDFEMEEFDERLNELDNRFSVVLGDRRAQGYPLFWTDPGYWWDHPVQKHFRR
jgi:hypothetical protein